MVHDWELQIFSSHVWKPAWSESHAVEGSVYLAIQEDAEGVVPLQRLHLQLIRVVHLTECQIIKTLYSLS